MSGKQAKRLRKKLAELDRGEFYLEMAKRNLRRHGDLRPVIAIDGPEETVMVDVTALWTTREEKRASIPALGGLLGFGLDARTIWVIADTWVRKPGRGEDPEEVVRRGAEQGLAEDPLATECLMVWMLTKSGGFEAWLAEYTRTGTGFRFRPASHSEGGEEGAAFESQFSHFFDAQRASEAKARELAVLTDFLDGVNDQGETWEQVARRTARMIALRRFKGEVFSVEDLEKAAKAAKKSRP